MYSDPDPGRLTVIIRLCSDHHLCEKFFERSCYKIELDIFDKKINSSIGVPRKIVSIFLFMLQCIKCYLEQSCLSENKVMDQYEQVKMCQRMCQLSSADEKSLSCRIKFCLKVPKCEILMSWILMFFFIMKSI